MVHGVVVSGTYFQPVARKLDDDFAIYVPDLPGTGRSSSRCGFLGLEELADKLAWWLDEHGVTGAVLVANSIGCQVLTHLAVNRPDLVKALVLVSPTMDPAVRSSIQVMMRGLLDLPHEALGLWPVWFRDLTLSNPISGLRTLRRSIRDPQLERAVLIQAPVLVVGGERDPIVPPGWVQDLADVFPLGRAMVMPGVPHAINFTNPRELAWVIRAVVRSELHDPGALFE
jgi:pimeloyl-ACP methyl ester carboxylesterase